MKKEFENVYLEYIEEKKEVEDNKLKKEELLKKLEETQTLHL